MRDRVLWIGAAIYAAMLTWLGTIKYDAHRNLVDFGIFAQTAASAFGCFCNPVEGSHWAFHFSPILYVVGVAVAIARTPLTLIALQSIAGALTAPPIYALVFRLRPDRAIARLAAVTVWLYPPLAGLIFGDFHENVFAPAAVAWTLYCFDAGLLLWVAVAAAVALAVKEDQAVFLAIAGAIGAWQFRGTARGRVAAGIAVAGVLVAIAFFVYIQPHAATATSAQWQPQRFYAWGAGDVHGLGGGVLPRIGFVVLAFAPLLLLPLRSGAIVLAIAPLGEVLLSRMPTTFTIGTHYAGAWIGYVLVVFAFSVRRLAVARARIALLACIAVCVAEFLVADPLHPGVNLRPVQRRDIALDGVLRTLPRDAGIATQEEAYTHLALRDPYARLFPESSQTPVAACLALRDRDFPDSPRLQEYGRALDALVGERRYTAVLRAGGITLYRRNGRCR